MDKVKDIVWSIDQSELLNRISKLTNEQMCKIIPFETKDYSRMSLSEQKALVNTVFRFGNKQALERALDLPDTDVLPDNILTYEQGAEYLSLKYGADVKSYVRVPKEDCKYSFPITFTCNISAGSYSEALEKVSALFEGSEFSVGIPSGKFF